MAGRSKWSKVKNQKSLTDKLKAQAFTKASQAITVAVREGGGITNPEENAKLRFAIEKAKALNMPKDTIDRAIARASKDSGQQLESLFYEAYGPGGVALIILAVTDNRQRTVSQIKNILDHYGGTLVSPGGVMFQFEKVVNNAGIEYQPKHSVDLPENERDLLSLIHISE
ncbi:MAG: YebC/PmpR family DNA-binding transcriptional regulator, partial [Patescibacteria group bacterium]|nr:YebC/PmpR family DNA-binding transcriptional regulator [Patescibacteria group bacterium]